MAQVDSETSTAMPADAAGGLYIPTDVTPEELFQAIGRLRKEARDEIHRLIMFLDTTDDYVSRELEDQVDDGPCDTDEKEPSLCGVTVAAANMPADGGGYDSEGDAREDDEDGHDREGDELQHGGDEHDGAEPDEDGEPLLGWTEPRERGQQALGSNGTEAEQGSTCPGDLRKGRARYRKLNGAARGVAVEDRGYGGRKVIRNLTDEQKAALHSKLDPYGTISVR